MSGMPQVQELMRSAKDTCTNTFTTRYDVKEALSGDGRSTRSDGRSDSGGVAKRPSHATLRPSLRHAWENAQATVPHDPQSLRHPSAVFRGCRRSSPLSVHGSGKRIKCDREFICADLVSSYRADNGIIRIRPLDMPPHWRGHSCPAPAIVRPEFTHLHILPPTPQGFFVGVPTKVGRDEQAESRDPVLASRMGTMGHS